MLICIAHKLNIMVTVDVKKDAMNLEWQIGKLFLSFACLVV